MDFTLEMEQLRAARRASRIPRPRARSMTRDQLLAYYGLAEDSVYSSQPSQESSMNKGVEEEAASRSQSTVNEEVERQNEDNKRQNESFNNQTAESCMETSKASITFGQSTLDAVKSIRRSQSTVNEEVELLHESSNNHTEISMDQFITSTPYNYQDRKSKFLQGGPELSPVAASTVYEDDEAEASKNLTIAADGSVDTSKTLSVFQNSTFDGFKSIRYDSAMDVDCEDAQSSNSILTTTKRTDMKEKTSQSSTPKSPASKRARISTTPRRSSTLSENKIPDSSFTPKKTISKIRNVKDQSFHAAKLPMLNLKNYEELPLKYHDNEMD